MLPGTVILDHEKVSGWYDTLREIYKSKGTPRHYELICELKTLFQIPPNLDPKESLKAIDAMIKASDRAIWLRVHNLREGCSVIRGVRPGTLTAIDEDFNVSIEYSDGLSPRVQRRLSPTYVRPAAEPVHTPA